MHKVEHHIHTLTPSPFSRMEKKYASDLNFSISDIDEYMNDEFDMINELFLQRLAIRGCFLNKPSVEVIRHWYDYQQALMMKLQPYFCQESRQYAVTFRGKSCVNKIERLTPLYFFEWFRALTVTLILRDPFDHLRQLVSIDESMFVNSSGRGERDFDLVLYRLFQGFLGKPKKDVKSLITDVIKFSEPEYVGDQEAQDYVYFLYLPLAQMLVYAQTPDRDVKYPEKLLHALESHRRYYTEKTSNGETQEYAVEGWLSFGITALAAYAYDTSGLVPDVKSEYMPTWLVKGEFPSYDEAFPELIHQPNPQYKDFMFTASCPGEVEWFDVITATIKWAKEEPNLPPVCDVIGRRVDSLDVEKRLQGEIFIDVLGDNPPELKLYSMEASQINDPDKWLAEMRTKWNAHVISLLPDAVTNVSFVEE